MKIEHKDAAVWSDISLGLSCENVQFGGGGVWLVGWFDCLFVLGGWLVGWLVGCVSL